MTPWEMSHNAKMMLVGMHSGVSYGAFALSQFTNSTTPAEIVKQLVDRDLIKRAEGYETRHWELTEKGNRKASQLRKLPEWAPQRSVWSD